MSIRLGSARLPNQIPYFAFCWFLLSSLTIHFFYFFGLARILLTWLGSWLAPLGAGSCRSLTPSSSNTYLWYWKSQTKYKQILPTNFIHVFITERVISEDCAMGLNNKYTLIYYNIFNRPEFLSYFMLYFSCIVDCFVAFLGQTKHNIYTGTHCIVYLLIFKYIICNQFLKHIIQIYVIHQIFPMNN